MGLEWNFGRNGSLRTSSSAAEPPELLSEGAKAAAPADTDLAKDDVPEAELQTARVGNSGDLTAGAASSGTRRPLEKPGEETFRSPQPPRRRLDPDSASERKRTSVEEAVPEQGSKIQRVSAFAHPQLADQRMPLYDFRVSAAPQRTCSKCLLLSQDESELMLMKTLENLYLWYDTEFERRPGREMHSMLDFDVFCEECVDQLTQEQLDNVHEVGQDSKTGRQCPLQTCRTWVWSER